jgi:UDP-glucose 4-epimerase
MRYVITGGSGYIGSRLVEHLHARDETEQIVICDLAPPRMHMPKTQFERLDVRDAQGVRSLLERASPDALVHLAFLLDPIHDEAQMYDVDVNGTHNVLDAASRAGTPQVLVTSSAVAYGAFPDNPVPLTEDDPVRGVASYSYARDKTESDRICQLWAERHPDRTMTIVRPCIVLGPNVDNSLVRIWTKAPFQSDFGHLDNQIQFVHEDDVVEAITRLLEGKHAGAYNLAGDGLMTLRECAELIGLKVRKLPLPLARRLAAGAWKLRQAEAPPGQLEYALHPWIVSNEKVKRTLDWKPRFSSRETFEIAMKKHEKVAIGDQAWQGSRGEALVGQGEPR